MLIDCSMHTGLGAGAPICPIGLALRSDRGEVRVEVECRSMKRKCINRRRSADRRVLAGIVGWFMVVAPDHVDSSSFLVQFSPRANSEDRVVIDGVPIGGRVGPSIRSVIASHWNVVVEFLRPQGNSKPMVVIHCSSCYWARCSGLSPSITVNGSVPNRNHLPVRNFSS
jgi:hypothetical protein